jgi:DUF4097 and DUF4098 domain-containing protein YvlB
MSTYFSRIAASSLALAFAAAAHAGTFQREVAAGARGEVDVSNVAGAIVISGWDRPQVSVTADLPGDTQRVKLRSGQGRTIVCVTYRSGGCDSARGHGEAGPVRLELHVPAGSEIRASAVSADITSRGIAGAQHLYTVSGNIRAALGSGDDDVQSVSGNIRLHGSGEPGTLRVSTVSGDLSVTKAAGELVAKTIDGTLSADVSAARRVRLNTTSGSIEVSAQLARGGRIETETVSGRQKIEVSAPAGYSYVARSFSGNIQDCFARRPNRSQYGPGRVLEGTQGGGDGKVRLRSLSGDISLCDH